jgi:hypothetical protein
VVKYQSATKIYSYQTNTESYYSVDKSQWELEDWHEAGQMAAT